MKRLLLTFALSTLCCWAQTDVAKPQVSLPGKTWAVVINAPGFKVEQNLAKPDGRQYLLAKNAGTGVVLSITLERNQNGADPGTCLQYLYKRIDGLKAFNISGLSYWAKEELTVAEYTIPELEHVPLRQMNFVGCTAKEDVFIDIHLSKVEAKPSDQKLLTENILAINIGKAQSATAVLEQHDSRYYLEAGSRSFIQNDYKNAIGPYEKALSMEKQQRKLDADLWRVLIDNLGMAYGISGDLSNAEATFTYGLANDPTYPMFSYNMACTYAERNDLENTIVYLKKAFENKANVIHGEHMPDPRTDDSFKRFLKEPKFQALLNSL